MSTDLSVIINGVLWHSPEVNFTGRAQVINPQNEFEKYKSLWFFFFFFFFTSLWNYSHISQHAHGQMSKFLVPGICDSILNTLRPRQNGRHFPDDIFSNKNGWIKFVPKVPINSIPALVQIMAWRRPGDKPLSEPMTISLLTHICVTRPQWVKSVIFQHMLWIKFVSNSWEIAFRWIPQNTFDDKVNIGSGNGLVPSGNKPLAKPMLTHIYVAIWHH